MDAVRVCFRGSGAFHVEIKRRVADYFANSSISTRDSARMYVKTAVILGWTLSCYLLLMFVAANWWQVGLCATGLALGMAGIGFSVQHDANHGAYSTQRSLNRLIGCTLDLIGGSSYVWYWRHNIIHHTYTNISGVDVDAEADPFLRLAPDQPLRACHRYQHLYVWVLYAWMPFDWHFRVDFFHLLTGKIGDRAIPKPSRSEWAVILLGKAIFYGWSLVLPLMIHPTWLVLVVYIYTSLTLGIGLTTTFQLAHCIEEADVVSAGSLNEGWAEHQVRTTANFAAGNKFLTWYLGGLNYQIEHHLFPKVCHVHYPALSRIVAATCKEYDIPYRSHRTYVGAVRSHIRWLRFLGREAVPASSAN